MSSIENIPEKDGHGVMDVTSTEPELYVDPAKEKALLLKLDLCLAPVITLIFLCAYLDRSNIGNAASAGMTIDLGMTSNDLGSMAPISYRRRLKSEKLTKTAKIRCRDAVLRPVRLVRGAFLAAVEETPTQ